jgi:hypothetical protein
MAQAKFLDAIFTCKWESHFQRPKIVCAAWHYILEEAITNCADPAEIAAAFPAAATDDPAPSNGDLCG